MIFRDRMFSWTHGMGVLSQLTASDGSALRWLADAGVWLLYVTTAAILLFYILRRRDLPLPRAFWIVVTYVLAFGAVQLLEAAFYWRDTEPLSPMFKAVIAFIAWAVALSWVTLVPRILHRRSADDLQHAEEKRQQAEQALKENETFYQTLIDALPINVFRKDKSGRIVYASLRYCETLGRSLDDLLGKTDYDLFPKELAEKYVRDDKRVIESGETLEDIERHQRNDGTEILVQVLKAPAYDPDGEIVGVQGMFWDVTSREKAEEAHRESEARLKSIMDNTAAVIYLKDAEYKYRMINRRFEQLFDCTNADVQGKTDFDIWPQELAEAFQANDRVVLETGRIVECEEVAQHADGLHTYLSVKFPLRNAQGDIYAVAGISTDITERKRAELALRESEDRRNLALEAAGIGTWTWNIDDDSMDCDERLHNFFDIDKAGFTGTIEDFFERVHPEDRVRVRAAIRNSVENNADYDIDFRIHRTDGEIRNIVSRAAVIRDEENRAIRMTGVCLDVTDRERAEQALREVEERMRRVVESAHDAFIAINADGYVIEWNREAERTFGWRAEEAVGELLCNLIVPERDRPAASAAIGNYVEGTEGPYLNRRFETEALRKDGSVFPIEMTITPVRVGDSHVFSAFLHDITDRRQAEEALRRSDARFRRLVESNIVGVTIDHFDGTILESNDAFLRMTGYTRKDLKSGKLNWEEMTPAEHKESTRDAIERLRTSGSCTVREKEFFRKDGKRVPVLVGVTMLEESGDKCICITVDITERKRALSELQTAKEQADAANEAKSRFLANMSHEIRTPMNAIIGLTGLVLDTPLENMQRDYLQMVQTSAEALLAIINDVLDYSKIEADRLEIARSEFRVRELVGDVLKSLAVRAHESSLELAYDVDEDVPEFVIGDAGRLRQILNNLIGNAIKFTEAGEVVVTVDVDSRQNGSVLLNFQVRDTGIGIPAEDLDSIFNAFEQVDTSSTRRFAGTGLGLAISQRLVKLLGGEIWAESEIGQGSILHFTCRVDVQQAEPNKLQQPAISLAGLHVLIVDDNETNGRILESQLDNWGMRPTRVNNAEAALTALHQAAKAGSPFDLALIDGNMPNVDGFQLTERIRRESDIAQTLVLLLTSGGRPGDLDRCRQLDISRYLTKPAKPSELLDAITRAADEQARSDTESLSESASDRGVFVSHEGAAGADLRAAGELRILLAEDSLVNQKLAIGLLEKKGYKVSVVNNGQEALAAFEEHDYDLILMDVQMPLMDGLEATAAIRKREAETGQHIPIIAMTAHAMIGDRERCLESGMDEYVAKPIRADVLYEAIQQLTGVPDDAPNASPTNGGWMKATDRLDWNTAWETVGGDLDLLRELVSAFLEELPELEQHLAAAAETEDAAQVRMTAHKIKGSLRYFGAKTAYDFAYKLESAAEDGTMSGVTELVDSLRKELAAIGPLLRKFLREPGAARDFRST